MTTITETLLKRTTSRCPVCHDSLPSEVWKVNDGKQSRVFLRRECAVHGAAEVCISSDARFYCLAQGSPENRPHPRPHPRRSQRSLHRLRGWA